MPSLNILIVDDEQGYQDAIAEYLESRNHTPFKVGKPSEALRIVASTPIHIAIVDLRLPEMDGVALLHRIHEANPDVAVIMISGHGDMDSVIEAMREGAVDFFRKPFKLADISLAIERTCRLISLQRRLDGVESTYRNLLDSPDSGKGRAIVGKGPAMSRIRLLISKVAASPHIDVLITGESGSGKELVARAIHEADTHATGVFYDVNCPAIPETLFESEAFGHRKHAFTGAEAEKKGFFEIASGGTLFLDEIGDLSLNMQSKLLRALEERTVRRVGSTVDVPVQLRVMASTNRDIEAMAREGAFRRDLYYRLNRFFIHTPPLRERREDIPDLIDHFNHVLSSGLKRPLRPLTLQATQALSAHDYPGNVRELRNMIEKALILANPDDETIGAACFPDLAQRADEATCIPQDGSLRLDQLRACEIELIRRAMTQCGGNKSAAARLLGITRVSLHRRIEKFGLRL